MMTDLEKAVACLQGKQARLKRLFDYYEGRQPLLYTRERLQEIFKDLSVRLLENWCAVVIDSTADRITLNGFSVGGDKSAQQALDAAWRDLDLAIEADDAHEAALVAGEAYLIVWLDGEPGAGAEIQADFCDPRKCHVHYDPEYPKRKLWAAKWWPDEDGGTSLVLYYPDRLEYYTARKNDSGLLDAKSFQPDTAAYDGGSGPNPFGVVPVFHLKNKRRRSDLDNTIPIQDGVNKLLGDMIVAAEFQALPQRYVIANSDTAGLKNAPGELWTIPAGDGTGQQTQVGQFGAADLANYYRPIAELVSAIGAITGTPKHFFYQQGGDPSGESLIAMEAPLNKKAKDRIDRFVPEWRQLAAFLLQLRGIALPPSAIEPLFAKPETVQPRTAAEVRQLDVKSGIPLRTILRREGWSDAELDQLDEDQAALAAAQNATLAGALVDAQRRFDRAEMPEPAVMPMNGAGNG